MVQALVKKAVALGLVDEDNVEIYAYGLEDFLHSLLSWGLFLAASLCINMFWQMLLFMLMHIPLRIYAGGLHFATRFRCLCVSVVIFAVVFTLPQFATAVQLASVIIWTIVPCICVIWRLAPVEDLRKPLNSKERKHHGKVSLVLCLIGSAIVAITVFLHYYQMTYFLGSAIIVVSLQLILGFIKNRIYQPR